MAFNYYQPTVYPIGYNSSPVGYNSSPTYSNSNTGMVWVNDYNEAVMYPVAPKSGFHGQAINTNLRFSRTKRNAERKNTRFCA